MNRENSTGSRNGIRLVLGALCACTIGYAASIAAHENHDASSDKSNDTTTTQPDAPLSERLEHYEKAGGDPRAARSMRNRSDMNESVPSFSGVSDSTQQLGADLKDYEDSGGDPAAAQRNRDASARRNAAQTSEGSGASEKAQALEQRLNAYEKRGGSPGGAQGDALETNDTATNPDR